MTKKLMVETDDLEKAAKEFIEIWHQIEQGHEPKTPIEKISFITTPQHARHAGN
jgi:hypothetical protein